VFEGEALLRRMLRYKLLPEDEKRLDFVLQLTTQKLLERRLQTLVRSLCVCCVLCCASAGAVPALALWSGLVCVRRVQVASSVADPTLVFGLVRCTRSSAPAWPSPSTTPAP